MTATVKPPNPPANANAIAKIMESMGWSDGTFIPIATEDNRLLMQTMQSLLARKDHTAGRHAQLQHRVRSLRERRQHARDDIGQNGKLLEAHRSQLSAEHHMYKVAEYSDGSLGKRHKELLHGVAELERHDKFTCAEVARSNGAIAKLSGQIQWSRDALAEFQSAMQHGDNTNQLIARYCKQDEQQARDLETRRQQQQLDVTRLRAVLVATSEEQRSLENVLDRTAQLYRQAHHDRSQLVDTWKEAVASLRCRDRDIQECETQLDTARQLTQRREQQLREAVEFLELQLQNNREAEHDIGEQNARLTQTRDRLTDITTAVQVAHNEATTLQKLLANLAGRLQHKRQQNRQANVDLTERTAQLQRLGTVLEQLHAKYAQYSGQKLSGQERLRHLDELVEAEQKQLDGITAESARLGGSLFRSGQMVLTWREEHKLLELQIAGLEVDIAAERATLKRLDDELMRQIVIVYNIEYKTSVYQTRVNNMKGDGLFVNSDLEDRINVLEAQADAKQRTHDTVKKQVQRIENEMRHLTASIKLATGEQERLRSKLDSRRLELEGGQKELATTATANHEQLVDQSMLKLRVHQMEETMRDQRDRVYNLQRHQNDLQLAMNERLLEIETRRAGQQQALKHLTEELTQLRADVSERNVKIAAVRARFECAEQRLGRNEDGTCVTAAQIRIETAQEKQMLLREGNELNERVLRAERDIKAIENTLVMVNYVNEAYRKRLESVKEDSKEAIALDEATNALDALRADIKHAQQRLAEHNKRRQLAADQQLQCEQSLEHIGRLRSQDNETLVRLHKEMLDQKAKLERAQRELKLARKTARTKIGADNASPFLAGFERLLRVRELEAANAAVMHQLAEMVDDIAGMATTVHEQLYERGLSMPERSARRSGGGGAGVADGRGSSECSSSWSGSVRSGRQRGGGVVDSSAGGVSMPLASSIDSSQRGSSLASERCASRSTETTGRPAVITLDFPGVDQTSYASSSKVVTFGGIVRRSK